MKLKYSVLEFLLPSTVFLLISCTSKDDSILLECDGIETTYEIKNGVRGQGEERHVKKSIRFNKEIHDLKINSYLTEVNIKEGKPETSKNP